MAVTAANVIAVLEGDYNGTSNLDGRIATATRIVARVVSCASDKGITLTTEEQEDLITYIAAWLYALTDKPYSSSSTLGASGSYHGQTGMGFEANLYGQTALRLDPSGCLSALDKQKMAGGFWNGKRTQEQQDYDVRNTRAY